jgi:hypothetical protein
MLSRICIRLDIAGHVTHKNASVSPLSLWECMYRTHGGQVFGDMVDTF